MTSKRIIASIAAMALLLVGVLAGYSQGVMAAVQTSSRTAASLSVSSTRTNLSGTIASAAGSVLKVSLFPSRKSATIALTSKTTYSVNGKSSSTHPTWKKGEHVQVIGTKQKNGTYRAQVVTVSTGVAQAPPPHGAGAPLGGAIVSSSSSALVVKAFNGAKTTVKLTAKTKYVVNGKVVSAKPTWKKGEQVQFAGTKVKNGTYTATSVTVGAPSGQPGPGGPPGGGMPPVTGKVVSSTSTKLVVKSSSGTATYTLNSSTRYLIKGKSTSSRPAFKAGQQVHIMASKSGKTLIAQMVIIGAMPAPPAGGAPPPQQP